MAMQSKYFFLRFFKFVKHNKNYVNLVSLL